MRERKLAPRPLSLPATSRLPLDAPDREELLAAHTAAMERGEVGYLDPSSALFVLTAQFLAARGTCCKRGCRHCPYEL